MSGISLNRCHFRTSAEILWEQMLKLCRGDKRMARVYFWRTAIKWL